jgi:serine/threonine-protein kinase
MVAGRFEVESIVGAGPHGTVYEAVDVRNTARIALKVLGPGVARAGLVRRQAIRHPNLVDIDGIEPVDDCLGLRMELVRGFDVATLLAEAPFPIAHALRVTRQALDGLRAVHDVGLAHGDLKPENLMVTGIGIVDADVDHVEPVRVLDVGLASMIRPRRPSLVHEPPLPYAAPEVALSGVASKKGDLYAMGVILVEMLTGEPVSSRITLGRDWPEGLAFLIWKAVQRDPNDRFRDAAEMIAAIDVALAHTCAQ